MHFNPRPPCGGRRDFRERYFISERISIHVPRVEDDFFLSKIQHKVIIFQSTSPVWRTTHAITEDGEEETISIHVPRVEDDYVARQQCKQLILFQSTSPVWRTTTA